MPTQQSLIMVSLLSYVMKKAGVQVPFTLSHAINFREDWQDLPVFDLIDQIVRD